MDLIDPAHPSNGLAPKGPDTRGPATDKRFVEERAYNIQNLWELHHEIIRQISLGATNKEVAENLGISPQTVSNTRNSPLAKEKLAWFQEKMDLDALEMSQRIQRFAPRALSYLEDIIAGEVEGVSVALRAKYADKHLGRAGHGEVKKSVNVTGTLTKDEIEALKRRSKHSAKDFGESIDADYTEL